jgi:hypothetical protein
LFRINIGANGNVGNLLNVTDASSTLFSVSETIITSALPHTFTASGDVSISYDLIFANQTSSLIDSYGPLTIRSGESFESNNLTLSSYNSGNILLNTGATAGKVAIGAGITPTSLLHASNTATATMGKALAIFDQDENQDIIAASNSGTTRFSVSYQGVVNMGLSATSSTTAVCSSLALTTAPTAGTPYEIRDCDGAPAQDYAEMYPTQSDVAFGDIVAVGPDTVEIYADDGQGNVDYQSPKRLIKKLIKTNSFNQSNIIGIVSNNYGDFSSTGHKVIDSADHPMPVALAGRVPVKIDPASANIEPGDYLTTSSVPGTATKALQPGFIIGKALNSWSAVNPTETVIVYVSNSWADPDNSLASNASQDISLSALSDQIASVSAQLAQLELATASSATLSAQLAELSVLGDASVSGQLSVSGPTLLADTTVAGKLYVGLLKFDDLESSIESLTGVITAKGDLTVTGNLLAKKYNVDTSDVLGASIGKATIPSGLTELVVETTAASTASSIFITPENIATAVAFDATESGKFTVRIPAQLPQDLRINWWIIN